LNILITIFLNALALLATAYLVPGFKVDSFTTALLAAIVIGVINTVVRPILTIITLPINLLTLGLFTFVINAVVLYLTTLVVPGLILDGILTAILGAIVLSVVSTILSHLAKELKLK